MFMASNQFRVVRGREAAFEAAWAATSARLSAATGLIGVRCDKGKELHQHVLYFAITIWESEMCFLEWKRCELYGGCASDDRAHAGLARFRLEEFDATISRNKPQ
jgi:heme-degrading monooxygenase HmoA